MNFERILAMTNSLRAGQRLSFHESFAFQLTCAIRQTIVDDILDDDKLRMIGALNDILHRSIPRNAVLRLKTSNWSEKDFWSVVAGAISSAPDICPLLEDAVEVAAAGSGIRLEQD